MKVCRESVALKYKVSDISKQIKNEVFVSEEDCPIRLGRKYRDIARNVYFEYIEKRKL